MELLDAIEKENIRAIALHGLKLKNDERSRIASSLFAIAQQHHNAILLLLTNKPPLHASAFALFRPLIEVAIRGVWVIHCATDVQMLNVIEGNEKQLKIYSLFDDIEKSLNTKSANQLEVIKFYKSIWKTLSAFTHGYEQQVQRWLMTKDIEPNYSIEEINELITKADLIANLVFVTVKSLEEIKGDRQLFDY